MKSREVLERIVKLLKAGKIQDADVQAVLNGALINGQLIYQNGMVKDQETGRVSPLSADKITSITWPSADADIRATKKSNDAKSCQKKSSPGAGSEG